MINQAKKKVKKIGIQNIRFIVSPMEKLKLQKIDFAVSSVAFHHIRDKELVLSKIHQILQKGGKVLIGDWFKPRKEFKMEVEKLRKKKLKRTKEFDKSWRQFLSDMT